MKRVNTVLSIAGMDPSAGAGLYSDLRTFNSLGLWGMGLVTSLTVQGPSYFKNVLPVDYNFFNESVDSIFKNHQICGVKIGLITESFQAEVIERAIVTYMPDLVVLDPVMISSTRKIFWNERLIDFITGNLMKRVDVITPNIREAIEIGKILGVRMPRDYSNDELYRFIDELQKSLRCSVALTAGDVELNGEIFDLYYDGVALYHRRGKKIEIDKHYTHGTGCAFSSALLSYMVKGYSFIESCKLAATFVEKAISTAVSYGLNEGGLNIGGIYDRL